MNHETNAFVIKKCLGDISLEDMVATLKKHPITLYYKGAPFRISLWGGFSNRMAFYTVVSEKHFLNSVTAHDNLDRAMKISLDEGLNKHKRVLSWGLALWLTGMYGCFTVPTE